MAQKVRYNGGTLSYYGCSDPRVLVVGKEYEVEKTNDRVWQTDYTLKGIKGEFNSVWFDEITPKESVYMAISMEVPRVGKQYLCYKIEFVQGQPQLVSVYTSEVKEVKYMGNNIYQVATCNSMYIVKIN